MAYSSGRNPFMDNPDDDFMSPRNRSLNDASSRYDDPFRHDKGDPPPYDEDGSMSRNELLQQRIDQSINRQLEATHRCLASINDSEQIGIATAEELVQQGEQLDNVERKVDKINADTKVSQRHLNSIKSIFGGIRNWWNGEAKKDEASATSSGSNDQSGLRKTIAAANRDTTAPGTHPSLRLRSDDVRGFYDDDVVEFGASGTQRVVPPRSTAPARDDPAQTQYAESSSRSAQMQEYEKNLNTNLDMMSSGVGQLKSLAVGLGNEIASQNDQIERIAPKVERADTKIRDQNRQMRQILGK